ncbi:hypothetical protein AVEN_207995-1 [Araneus ventricosus]|uniref:Speckle-type POZ protein n=1 Tax=Araneus ventricosus TaxID=182803 RepID=A0A4Y2J8P7_ARAVE|nr:hypothetical protein AVEN_207995-1 [Araneus ventricosus]
MARANQSERKCFTFLWVLQNADFCWQEQKERIESPSFVVEELEGTKWKLWLYPRGILTEDVALFLIRDEDTTGAEYVKTEYDLAFLDSDNKVLKSIDKVEVSFHKDHRLMGHPTVMQSNEFDDGMPKFMSNEAITVRCRIWKCVGEFSDNMICRSCNRIYVEGTVSVWRIKNFSSLDTGKECIHEIKSMRTGEHLMSLKLLPCKLNSAPFQCDITPRKHAIKSCKIGFVPLVASGQLGFILEGFYKFDVPGKTQKFVKHPSFKGRLMEDKHLFLPNGVLSLLCICKFCYGVVMEEDISTSGIDVDKIIQQHNFVSKDNPCSASSSGFDDLRKSLKVIKTPASDDLRSSVISASTQLRNDFAPEDGICSSSHDSKSQEDKIFPRIAKKDCLNLIRDFGFMWLQHIHSDIKLRTSGGTYPAHKCVLSARSSVFKAIFSNYPRENDCLVIKDVDGDTVWNMLMYIYSGFIVELDWDIAFGLYEAAAKYKLLALRDVCSSYLKKHLCLDNAFETCLLGAQYADDDLKDFVHDFISRRTGSWRNRFRKVVKRFRRGSSARSNSASSLNEERSVVHKNALIEDFKAMLDCSIYSDIKLRTSGGTYPAHKCVLSARSQVFKSILSNHSRESDCLDIEDLDGDTVCRMLRYIYSDEPGELGWDSATGLYAAGNKYEFQFLKNVCSSYLEEHLCKSKVHETLQLLQLHPDKDLEYFVMDFVTRNIGDYNPQECSQMFLDVVKLMGSDPDDSELQNLLRTFKE